MINPTHRWKTDDELIHEGSLSDDPLARELAERLATALMECAPLNQDGDPTL